MNVLVVDEEILMIEKIKDLLYEIDDSIKVIGLTGDMLAAADWISKNPIPDLILAKEGIVSGHEKQWKREVKAVVTFSTNTGAYNFDAFRYKTFHTILNNQAGIPTRLHPDHANNAIKEVTTGTIKERFLVKQGQRLLSIPVAQIAYFFSQERFIFFKTFDNQKFLLEYRIEQLEQVLSPDIFFRVNRSFIVSLATVKEIHAYFGNRLKLYLSPATDKDVIVSRKRVSDFKEWLGK